MGDRETVFDYHIDPSTKDWRVWEAEDWTAPRKIAFS